MIKKLLIVLVLWMCMFIILRCKKESFEVVPYNHELLYQNNGDAPWLRYNVHQTLFDDPTIKYQNAYYYEYPNEKYKNALINTMTQITQKMSVSNNWLPPSTPDKLDETYQQVYDVWMNLFSKTVRMSPDLLLPNETSNNRTPIQVVHDRWISSQLHATEKQTIRMEIEIILYRNSKPHGKHIHMIVVAKNIDKQWNFHTEVVHVMGIIPEDQIALFPVHAKNPFDKGEMKFLEDPNTFITSIIPPEQIVLQEIKKHNFLQRRFAEGQMR